jgi:hypothetical protein
MSTTSIVLCLVILAALVAIAIAAAQASRRSRALRLDLRRRFGPEYDRAIAQYGSTRRAETELLHRERRVARLRLHELGPGDQARFTAAWETIQGRFVDDPARAVREANELVEEVMRAMGYPTNDFPGRVADLSVGHAPVVDHYRAAHALASSNQASGASTEDLRQAVVHYRALFAELIVGNAEHAAAHLRQLPV